MRQAQTRRSYGPVAIGGVGGSGTRLVADVTTKVGFYLGSDQNPAGDNLWFSLLFKAPRWYARQLAGNRGGVRRTLNVFERLMTDPGRLTPAELATVLRAAGRIALAGHQADGSDRGLRWPSQRVLAMLRREAAEPSPHWGWKEPNTHIFLPDLAEHFSDLRYIHVIRHGIDMAYSRNQFQLHNWGGLLGVEPPPSPELLPGASLRYWARANLRAVDLGKRLLGERFLLLNYDELCASPERGLDALLGFLRRDVGPELRAELASLPRRPPERHTERSLAAFDPEDIAALEGLGFDAPTAEAPA